MAFHSDLSLPELSKQQLLELFSTSEEQSSQWCTVVPKEIGSLTCTPSDSHSHYQLSFDSDNEVKEYLGKEFKEIFTQQGHVETYWVDFAINVTHKLGLTYREVQQKNGTFRSYSEAKLQQCILNPILKEVSGAACTIFSMKGETLKTDFLTEDEIELQDGKPGSKPRVDAVIQISNKDGKVKTSIPIEMKLNLATNHYSQIACYMNKLSTAEDIRGYITVGILIDKKQFRLAFSAFRNRKGNPVLPLPVVHISPPIQWRSESTGIIVQESMLTLACTFLVGQVDRLEFDPKKHLQNPDITVTEKNLLDMSKFLLKNPYTFLKPKHESVLSLTKKLEEQQKEIDELKENQKEIKELKEKVKELQESGAGSPRRKRPRRN